MTDYERNKKLLNCLTLNIQRPMTDSAVSKVESKFPETSTADDHSKVGRPKINNEAKFC